MDLKIFKQKPININMAGISSEGLAAADTSVSIFQKINAQIKSTQTENHSKQEEPIKSKDGNYSFLVEKKDSIESVITFTDNATKNKYDITLSNFNDPSIKKFTNTLSQASDDFLADLCAETKTIKYDPDLDKKLNADGLYIQDIDEITLDNVDLYTLTHEVGHAVSFRNNLGNNLFSNCVGNDDNNGLGLVLRKASDIKIPSSFDNTKDLFSDGLNRFTKDGNHQYSYEKNAQNKYGTYATANSKELYAEGYALLQTGKCQSKDVLLKYFPESLLAIQKDVETTRNLSFDKRNLHNKSNTTQNGYSNSKIATEISKDESGNPLKIETLKLDDIMITVTTDKSGKTSTNIESKEKFKNTDEKVKSDGIITTSYYRDFNENLTTKTRHQCNFIFENKDLVETILDNTTIKYPDGEETTNTLTKTKFKDGHLDVSNYEKSTCSNGEIKENNSTKSTFNDGHIETNMYTKITDKNGQEIIKGNAESTLPDGPLTISNYKILTDQSKKGKVNSSSKSIFKDGHSEIHEQEGTIDSQGKITIINEKKYVIPIESKLKNVK